MKYVQVYHFMSDSYSDSDCYVFLLFYAANFITTTEAYFYS